MIVTFELDNIESHIILNHNMILNTYGFEIKYVLKSLHKTGLIIN